MNYNIKGTELDITDELRTYVEKKLAAAEKFIPDDGSAHADVELAYSPVRDGNKYRAEFNVMHKGELYRAEEWGSALHEAIDLAIADVVRELSRDKQKRVDVMRRGAAKAKEILRFWRSA